MGLSSKAGSPAYYPFMDGFRALAALAVILHHLGNCFDLGSFFPRCLSEGVGRFTFMGSVGVDIFFVISGFLISGLLFEDLPSRIRVRRFYLRRSFKMLPQYLAVVLVSMAVLFFSAPSELHPLGVLSYFLLFQNYIAPIGLLAHLWSIAVEEHFYILYPILLQGVGRIGKDLRERKRILLASFLVIMVIVFFVRRQTFISLPYNENLIYQMSHLRIDALLCGGTIKLFENDLKGTVSVKFKYFPCICFWLGMALFYKLFIAYDQYRSMTYVWAYAAGGSLLTSALCGFRPLLALTENGLMRWVGRCSYGIYIWHYLIIVQMHSLVKGQSTGAAVVITFLLTIGAGVLSTVTVEKYFLNLRTKLVR